MINKLTLLLSVVLLTACSDGGSNSSTSAPSVDEKSNYNVADFLITQVATLPENGTSQLKVQLNNLTTDDEVYLTANSSDAENGKLKITPYRTILNPNKGSAEVLLSVKDLGLSSQPSVIIEVTTSSNTKMEQTVNMEWAN